jgi:integrase
LQPEELPKGVAKDPPRVLSREEVASLLAGAPERYRPMIGIAVFGGLRQAEVLGLRWLEIDFNAGVLKVRHQLTRGDRTTPPRAARLKTKAGSRDVILPPRPCDTAPDTPPGDRERTRATARRRLRLHDVDRSSDELPQRLHTWTG